MPGGPVSLRAPNPALLAQDGPLLRRLIAHFQNIAPTWLLLRLGMASTIWMAPLLRHCSDIVVVPRLILIKGTEQGGMEDHAWYRFDINHTAGPVLHNNRGKGEVIPPRRTRICEQCRKAYEPQRSSSRFCSPACRQRAHHKRLSVTLSVTPTPNTAIEPSDLGTVSLRPTRRCPEVHGGRLGAIACTRWHTPRRVLGADASSRTAMIMHGGRDAATGAAVHPTPRSP